MRTCNGVMNGTKIILTLGLGGANSYICPNSPACYEIQQRCPAGWSRQEADATRTSKGEDEHISFAASEGLVFPTERSRRNDSGGLHEGKTKVSFLSAEQSKSVTFARLIYASN